MDTYHAALGMEPPSNALWQLTGHGAITGAHGFYGGQNALNLSARVGFGAFTSGAVLTSFPVDLGVPMTFTFKVNGDGTVTGCGLDFSITCGVDNFGFSLAIPTGSGWQDFIAGPFTPSASSLTLTITVTSPSTPGVTGLWLIDQGFTSVLNQHYPPDNGRGPISNRTWYVDDVLGVIVPRDQAYRDDEDRLVSVYERDKPGRDVILRYWHVRPEPYRKDP